MGKLDRGEAEGLFTFNSEVLSRKVPSRYQRHGLRNESGQTL